MEEEERDRQMDEIERKRHQSYFRDSERDTKGREKVLQAVR